MSTHSALQQLREALSDHYAIGKVRSIRALPLQPMRLDKNDECVWPDLSDAFCAVNDLPPTAWQVVTEKGVFCLKQHRLGKSQSRVEFEEFFQRLALERKFALVPALIATVDGNWHIVHDKQRYWLTHFVDCDRAYRWYQHNVPAADARLAVHALAAFHCYSFDASEQSPQGIASAKLNGPTDCMPSENASVLPYLCAWVEEAAALWQNSSVIVESGPVADLRKGAANAIEDIRKHEQLFGSLPILAHGDFHPGNLLFCNEQVSAIVDYEHLHMEDPLYDLGYLVRFCARPAFGALEPDWMLTLLEIYKQDLPEQLAKRCTTHALIAYMNVASCLLVSWLIGKWHEEEGEIRSAFATLVLMELGFHSDVQRIREKII